MVRVTGRCRKRAWHPAESRAYPRDTVICESLELEAARLGVPALYTELVEVFDRAHGRAMLTRVEYVAYP